MDDTVEKVVRVVMLNSFYKRHDDVLNMPMEISIDEKLAYSGYIYEFTKSIESLPQRFQLFQGTVSYSL